MLQVKLSHDVINGITQGYFCLIFGWIDGWKVIFSSNVVTSNDEC